MVRRSGQVLVWNHIRIAETETTGQIVKFQALIQKLEVFAEDSGNRIRSSLEEYLERGWVIDCDLVKAFGP